MLKVLSLFLIILSEIILAFLYPFSLKKLIKFSLSSIKSSLIYFDFPFWRAEIARLSLYIGNIEFEDIRITSDEFQRVKSNGHLDNGIKIPFHQLPCLVVDNISIAQTGGIGRFCGKLANLYPQNNNIEAALIDQYIDIATDITEMVSKTNTEDRNNIFIESLKRKLSILNNIAQII